MTKTRLENFSRHDFSDANALADAFAANVADVLREAIVRRGHALLALSGGTTPVRFFGVLSKQDVDWASVTITLADERWVPAQNERSNERLVREHLLHGDAAKARFVPLYTNVPSPEFGVAKISADIAALALPFDCMILGVGGDGHCASLFPDGDNFADAIDPNGDALVMPMNSKAAGEPRITLTLPPIAASLTLYLHMEGSEKNQVFDQIVRGEGALAGSPVAAIMRAARSPMQVYWCA